MAKGLGGWNFKPVPFEKIKGQALVWFTFPVKKPKKLRPFGHVGSAREKYFQGYVFVVHASQSKKQITESILKRVKQNGKLSTNYMGKYFVKARNVQ